MQPRRHNTEWLAYADEADLPNVALFDCAAKAWREANPTPAKNSNTRDYVLAEAEKIRELPASEEK